MKLYRQLSQIRFLKSSYAFKFLFVAFVGIHIPLIGMLFYVLYGNQSVSAFSILVFALLMTLVATGLTLVILKQLILPIEVASKTLDNYRKDRTVSPLPTNFKDEVGMLMANIQESVVARENFINEKQDLVYLLSHDLRTFAGNSQSLAKLIIDENPSEAVKDLAELICQSSDQQFHFIENLIKLLKEQDEVIKKSHQVKRIDFFLLFSAVLEQVDQQAAVKNIKLLSAIDTKEAFLEIDEELLIRVLVNLIGNAIKFSFPDSEIAIRIHLENKKLYFTVSDNGMGFDPNRKDELFNKFTKMSKLGTANEPSTGIGLYLCKKIIEKHHGQLTASSPGKNQGATFTIVFEV
jgi:signal transduction histidine kinase